MALELLPGRERARVGAVDEEDAVEVVDLVLERAGGQAALHLLVLAAVAVEVADADVDLARHVAAQVGHREAALVDLDHLVVERLDHRVDHHRERDRRLVRVARVVRLDLDDRDPQRLADLVRREAGAVGGALGLDQVVDQRLHLGRAQARPGDLAGALAQHRIAHGDDLANAHAGASGAASRIGIRTPRSAATSSARS